jgi:hypothetical protein
MCRVQHVRYASLDRTLAFNHDMTSNAASKINVQAMGSLQVAKADHSLKHGDDNDP